MSRVLALVEGQTEQTFVREVLAPDLGLRGVYLWARLVGKPGHKGGRRPWPAVQRELRRLLSEDPQRCVTTMFDYYGLPDDWPGRAAAATLPHREAGDSVEAALHADLRAELGESFDARRFIPYIQMHEFEALLFADPRALAEAVRQPELESVFASVVRDCVEPEGIDDDPATAPSKRILQVARGYDKVSLGTIVAKRIGLQRIRAACPHFRAWVERLEELGGARPD